MPGEVPVVTGYYRYTDIWFEWSEIFTPNHPAVSHTASRHQAIPDAEDRGPVKAILGERLWTLLTIDNAAGTFETGEARLLFSSAQIDYIRYWLHAMKLTKTIVPLPYSDCLLTESNLKTVSPVVYPDGGSLRNAIKGIDKNNKRLKGSNPTLTNRRHVFERVRAFWAAKKGVWCALDFEAWERDHTVLTEFGWSTIGWKEGSQVEDRGHLIVEEAKFYTNGQYVPDFRYVRDPSSYSLPQLKQTFQNYQHGESEIVKKATFRERIVALIDSLREYGPVFLIFHDNSQDVKDLKNLKVNLESMTYVMPDTMPDSGIFVIDTSDLIGALLGEGAGDKRSLQKTCSLLQISTEYLHNAGNDAHATLLAAKEMASGDPVDVQREKRWPNQTPVGVKVELKPWQEDSDYSDEEGILPPPPGVRPIPTQDNGTPAPSN
ncbi:hypothetical protein CVT26_007364 [Gymnopilus dilepis]|uniref:Gfd2/YDR514C-like C-terminal domain-containing protein n=1 Tax=Gymnopilus dilepis TaxID=231916 RepID=A0A409VNZ7_9AGAR|nr:hypothetical protein CVT26_007364 [Gymnopilus dilepis]